MYCHSGFIYGLYVPINAHIVYTGLVSSQALVDPPRVLDYAYMEGVS